MFFLFSEAFLLSFSIAPLSHNALHEITGSTIEAKVLLGLETWFSKENNRLSYENCFVSEQDGKVVFLLNIFVSLDT
ncbi:hypothetical protein AADZ13_005439 [Bacillus cereus]|nr:hypothetical protein CN298_16995 [Bacillus cereus]PFO89011.1 hypothetical protein COJ97_29440 [Bacillus cereus]